MTNDMFGIEGYKKIPPPRFTASIIESIPEMTPESLELRGDVPRRAWAEADGTFWGTPQSHLTLPSGVYKMAVIPNLGPSFLRQHNDTDELVLLPGSECERIVQEIQKFKNARQKFIDLGFLYKRGFLFWGPPGSGKTSMLQLSMRMLMDYNGVCALVDNPHSAGICLQALRRIEPERQIVAVMEDLDALCQSFGEAEYLALMDGEAQIDNIVFLATTNYPEKLDKRFLERPSRIDSITYIGMPCAEARRAFLQRKLPNIDEQELENYIALSAGYSIAHVKEFIILTKCLGMPLPDAAARLDKFVKNKLNSEQAPDRTPFGFT